MSPKRTGLGVPRGSSSIAAGAVNKTRQREVTWRLQGEMGEAQLVKLEVKEEKLSGVIWV